MILCILLLNQLSFTLAFLFLGISDTIAALIGRKMGKVVFYDKSLEGTIIYFISSSIILILLTDLIYYYIIIIALISTISESNIIIKNINDNIKIPIMSGLFCEFVI